MENLTKFLKTYQADVILALVVILVSITAFNLGKISALQQQKTPISITGPGTANSLETMDYSNSENQNLPNTKHSTLNAVSVVASKNSAGKVYHFPWCASGSKISEKNKITFTTEAVAIAAGYTLAGNCKK